MATHQQQQTQRQARRREYATTQRHWRSNCMRCIMNILGDVEVAKQPRRAAMEPYWTTVFTQPATVTMPECIQDSVQDSMRVRSKQRRSQQLDPRWPFYQGPTVLRLDSFEPSHWESSSGSSTPSSGARICPNTWQSPEHSSSPRNLRLLYLENSDLSPSPLSLLGSYIRY